MADFIPYRTALAGWVTALCGLPTQWADYPKDIAYNERGWCDLSISGDLTVGRDEVNDEYDSTEPDPTVSVRTYQEGARTFTFGIKIMTWIAKANLDAEFYAREIRDQLALPKLSQARLQAAGLAVAHILADVPVVTQQDGRPVSVHQLDIMMNTTSRREDTPGTWIETVADVDLEVPAGNVVATFDIDV
jgi:hypothetical protein